MRNIMELITEEDKGPHDYHSLGSAIFHHISKEI